MLLRVCKGRKCAFCDCRYYLIFFPCLNTSSSVYTFGRPVLLSRSNLAFKINNINKNKNRSHVHLIGRLLYTLSAGQAQGCVVLHTFNALLLC